MPRSYPSPWLTRMAAPDNLRAAWRIVRQRRGGPGVDGVTIAAFAAREAHHIQRLAQALLAQTYRPSALKRATLAKRHGRALAVEMPDASVLDLIYRFVQAGGLHGAILADKGVTQGWGTRPYL